MKEEKNLWSADVETEWHPPKGFFDQSADKIARGLKDASDSELQAMERLNSYINHAGTNLSQNDKERLEEAKDILEYLY